MPTVGSEINRRVSEILKLCMKLQKFGVDAIFEYCGTFLDLSVYLKGYLCSAGAARAAEAQALNAQINKLLEMIDKPNGAWYQRRVKSTKGGKK